jgi:hypothetical protein
VAAPTRLERLTQLQEEMPAATAEILARETQISRRR